MVLPSKVTDVPRFHSGASVMHNWLGLLLKWTKRQFFSAITNVHYFSYFMESYSAQRIESIPHFFGFLAIFLWSGQNFGAPRVIITFTENWLVPI